MLPPSPPPGCPPRSTRRRLAPAPARTPPRTACPSSTSAGDGERDRHPYRHAVRERRAAVALDGVSGGDAPSHHRRLLGHHADGPGAVQAASDADEQRAVAHRHERKGRPLAQLLHDLPADLGVAVELGRLGAVLEERQALRLGEGVCPLLGFVEVRALGAQVGTQPLEEGDLGLARGLGHEDDRAHPGALGRPGRGRTVIARGGGDHGVGAALAVGVQRGDRAAPLEHA